MENRGQRGFFGIIITKEILEDQELNVTDKFIYGYIASFQRCCFETNEKIAVKLGVSESTVAHSIPKLVKKGYLFIEKPANNSKSRRIYSIMDNPKKLSYLMRKGLFKGCGKPVENSEPPMQNLHSPMQNLQTKKTGVESAKFADIDIEQNKNKVKSEQKHDTTPAGLAGLWPASRLAVNRSDYESENDYEQAFYRRNTICLGEH